MLWTLIYLIAMIAGTAWNLSSIALDLSRKYSRIRRFACPVFWYGKPVMFLIIPALALSSAMLGHTWQWILVLLLAIDLYIADMFKTKEEHGV